MGCASSSTHLQQDDEESVIKDSALVYEGEYNSKKEKDGEGILRYKVSGSIYYQGQFKSDYFYGKGQIYLKNGDTYVGDFVMNRMHGYGKYTINSTSDVYEGTLDNGLRTGYGTYTYSNGDTYTGQFKNNKFHGKAILKQGNLSYSIEVANDQYISTTLLVNEDQQQQQQQGLLTTLPTKNCTNESINRIASSYDDSLTSSSASPYIHIVIDDTA